ncbi:MAG: hypothetical protein WC632_07845 [Candidatus Margulisiibacteriota bacterium]
MVETRGITLRQLGQYIRIPTRAGETEPFRVNQYLTVTRPRKGMGQQILKRRELATAAKLIGLTPCPAERLIRREDLQKNCFTIMAQRRNAAKTPSIILLDIYRNALGIDDPYGEISDDMFGAVVSPQDARNLYGLMDSEGKKGFWLELGSVEEMRQTQNILGKKNVLEAFDLLNESNMIFFWLGLEDEGIKRSWLKMIGPAGERGFLVDCLTVAWVTGIGQDKMESHFRDYFTTEEARAGFFGAAALFTKDVSAFKQAVEAYYIGSRSVEIETVLLNLNPVRCQEIFKNILLYFYLLSKKLD